MKPVSSELQRWWRTAVSCALLVLATGVQAAAQQQPLGRITGRVNDATTGAPLSDVQIYLVGADMGGISRPNGTFVIINVPAGTYQLRAERIGLAAVTRQVTVTAGGVLEENFQLSSEALGLDEIVVTGTAGAARRREVGNLVTQINTVNIPDRPMQVTDLLTANGSGIEITGAGGGEVWDPLESTCRHASLSIL